jgi:hypothetical protein
MREFAEGQPVKNYLIKLWKHLLSQSK